MKEKILFFFEKGNFPYRVNVFKTKEEQEKAKADMNEIIKYIAETDINEETDKNEELFKKYFEFQNLSDICSCFYTKQMIKRKTMN